MVKKKVNNNLLYVVVAIALVGGLMWAGVLPGWSASAEFLNQGGVTKDYGCVQGSTAGKYKLEPSNSCEKKFVTFKEGQCFDSSGSLLVEQGSAQGNTFDYDTVCGTANSDAKWFYKLSTEPPFCPFECSDNNWCNELCDTNPACLPDNDCSVPECPISCGLDGSCNAECASTPGCSQDLDCTNQNCPFFECIYPDGYCPGPGGDICEYFSDMCNPDPDCGPATVNHCAYTCGVDGVCNEDCNTADYCNLDRDCEFTTPVAVSSGTGAPGGQYSTPVGTLEYVTDGDPSTYLSALPTGLYWQYHRQDIGLTLEATPGPKLVTVDWGVEGYENPAALGYPCQSGFPTLGLYDGMGNWEYMRFWTGDRYPAEGETSARYQDTMEVPGDTTSMVLYNTVCDRYNGGHLTTYNIYEVTAVTW
jgi:hypothetical protein